MSKNIVKTIEELSLSQTAGDLWDEFNKVKNPNILSLFLAPNSSVTVRFLGPFVSVSRFYTPFLKYMQGQSINVEDIADRKPEAIKKVIGLFTTLQNNPRVRMDNSYSTIMKYLTGIEKGMTWQNCIMVNSFVRGQGDSKRIKVLTMPRMLCDSIINCTRNNHHIILNGLFAHDVSIVKTGSGIQTRFDVTLGNTSHLTDDDVNFIMGRGLIDIPTLIQELNRCETSAYYYKKTSDYKMPSEFSKTLSEGRHHIEEDEHTTHVEEHLNEIPVEAFERRNSMRGAIQSLEV